MLTRRGKCDPPMPAPQNQVRESTKHQSTEVQVSSKLQEEGAQIMYVDVGESNEVRRRDSNGIVGL